MKVKYLGLEDGGCLDVSKLTVQTQAELVVDLAKVGSDVQAILMKHRGKVVKVK